MNDNAVVSDPLHSTKTTSESLHPLVDVNNLSVELPRGSREMVQAVRSVSLQIFPGERVGIVGESGSGKSITGRAIAGLLPESRRVRVRGSIKYRGSELVNAEAEKWQDIRRSAVSMIFQDPLSFLNPTMRIGAQVGEALQSTGTDRRSGAAELEISKYLELAGLKDVEKLKRLFPFQLSGGMRQRVLIAIALAKNSELVIADEPTTALDVTVQAKVLETLSMGVQETGTALMMISHDLAVVSQMCDRVYVMFQGTVVEHGLTNEVFRNPQHPYTAALIKSVVSLSDDTDDLYTFSGSEMIDRKEI